MECRVTTRAFSSVFSTGMYYIFSSLEASTELFTVKITCRLLFNDLAVKYLGFNGNFHSWFAQNDENVKA